MSVGGSVTRPSFSVMGLFHIWQKPKRLLIPATTSEAEVQGHGDLEIRSVLLQLGIVHVNCEKLETHTHINVHKCTQSEGGRQYGL